MNTTYQNKVPFADINCDISSSGGIGVRITNGVSCKVSNGKRTERLMASPA